MFKNLLAILAVSTMCLSAKAEWVNILVNGDAEGEYSNTPCAFSSENKCDPHPALIEADGDDNHVFVVHATAVDQADDNKAWTNMFWIQAPKPFAADDVFVLSFRYKASKNVTVNTLAYSTPDNYLHWALAGDINFTTDWKEFRKEIQVENWCDGLQSAAFKFNQYFDDEADFYFDDLKWEAIKKEALWSDPEGKLLDWEGIFTYSAEDCQENITPGDFIKITISGVLTEEEVKSVNPDDFYWPQVSLQTGELGWNPITNAGVGGQTYPLVVKFPIDFNTYDIICADGFTIKGAQAFCSEIDIEKGKTEISENTVWFGEKNCNWGDAVSIPASVFANVKANDKLMVWTSFGSCQILLGGWSGLNLPVYSVSVIDNMTYEDGIATITMIDSYGIETEHTGGDGVKTINVFDAMKTDGVIIHGPTKITRVDFVPDSTDAISSIATDTEAPAEYYNLNGVRIANPTPGFYIVKQGSKVSKMLIK